MVTDIPDNVPDKAVAWYNTNTNEIHIIKDRFNALSDDDKSMFVLHEMVHALTEHNLNNPKFSKVKAKLEAIHAQLYAAWQDDVNKGFHEDKLALMLDSRDADGNILYGELIAYGLTDKAMQKFIDEALSGGNTESASMFDTAINYFLKVAKQVLGLNNKGFREFVNVTSQLMGTYDPVATNSDKKSSNDNSTHLYAQMTEDNVTDIVNQLSLQDVLKNSIFNGSDEFNAHLDKTIDGFIGSYLYNDTNKRKVNQAKAVKPKAFMIGLQMSDKEQAVYGATKAILDEFVKDKSKTSTQAIYEL